MAKKTKQTVTATRVQNNLATITIGQIQHRRGNPITRFTRQEAIDAVCNAIKIEIDSNTTGIEKKQAAGRAISITRRCDILS